jgi:hypothetical protein
MYPHLKLAAFLLFTISLHPVCANGNVRVMVQSGDAMPDGNGVFGRFGRPTINNSGQLAFQGSARGTQLGRGDATGIFLASSDDVFQLGRANAAATSGDTFTGFANRFGFSQPSLNDAGQVAFTASLNDFSQEGVYLASPGQLDNVARTGALTPSANGSFSSFSRFSGQELFNPVVTNPGHVSFMANLFGTQDGAIDNFGTFQKRSSGLFEVARKNVPFPMGGGTLGGEFQDVNNTGSHVFGDRGVAIVSPSETVAVLQAGQPTPSGNGAFDTVVGVAINQSNDVGISARLAGTAGGITDNTGVYLATSGGGLQKIIRAGDSAPGGNGFFSSTIHSPVMNDHSQFAIGSSLTGTNGGSADNQGVFLADASGVQEVVRIGESAPGGSGIFTDLFMSGGSGPANLGLNNQGQIVFEATIATAGDGAADRLGIFFWDGSTTHNVAHVGESFLGSTIERLSFSPTKGMNDLGQIAYAFELEDRRWGLALFSAVPEPTSFVLMLGSTLALSNLRIRSQRVI